MLWIGPLAYGLVYGPAFELGEGLVSRPAVGLVVGLTGGLAFGLGFELTEGRGVAPRPSLLGRVAAWLVYGLAFGVTVGQVVGQVVGLNGGLVVGLGGTGGLWAGSYIGAQLRPAWVEFGKVGEYLKVMVKPVLGYALSYFAIVFWFAGVFATAQRWAEFQKVTVFAGLPPEAGFGEYLYFSLVTAATVGYGDIHPVASMTKALTSLEIVCGVGWTVVVFGAVIAYLGPRFAEISERHNPQARAELATQLQQVQESVQQVQEAVRALQVSLVPATVPRRPWWAFWR